MSSVSSTTSNHPASSTRGPEISSLIAQLTAIRTEMAAATASVPNSVDADFRASATNLLHYLTLRHRDLRPLQRGLAELGLSSLGRSESHVMASVEAVLGTLHKLLGSEWVADNAPPGAPGFQQGPELLRDHTELLLGKPLAPHNAHIMVTMPTNAADDYRLVHDLMANGMDCMRINCAHDGPQIWSRMIENLRRAEQALGQRCKVSMDLGGPKLRTGPLMPGPAVIKLRPGRDAFGRVRAPARIWLSTDPGLQGPPAPADGCLKVPGAWLQTLAEGDTVHCKDARDARREFMVVDKLRTGCWLECRKTTYITNGTALHYRADSGKLHTAVLADVPAQEASILLSPQDMLILTPDTEPGRQATRDSAQRILTAAMIGCTLPEILRQVRPGEEVWFDDGKIGGEVESVINSQLHIRITHALPGGSRLRGDKGINFPGSDLQLPAMTDKDVRDLEFIAGHADMVALSFANTVEDVVTLKRHLKRIGEAQPAIVLKIETVKGFRNLPAMLLEAMSGQACGVMIARGDLAVEAGFARLAEVQEEILWLSEAAHVPVIWATQVLENMAKTGAPTRAEITDAAMARRAECVMLNKGPYIVAAVQTLNNILRRMQGHQFKKQSMLRELSLAGAYAPIASVPETV